MTVLSKTFSSGEECNRTDLIAYASYEYDRLCFILVPLRGKITLGPHPQNKNLAPFRGRFQKIRRAPPSLLYGSPPGVSIRASDCFLRQETFNSTLLHFVSHDPVYKLEFSTSPSSAITR